MMLTADDAKYLMLLLCASYYHNIINIQENEDGKEDGQNFTHQSCRTRAKLMWQQNFDALINFRLDKTRRQYICDLGRKWTGLGKHGP
jgi:hypothetical protein